MKMRAKIFINKANGQKLITIPSWCNLKAGDWITIDDKDIDKINIKNN